MSRTYERNCRQSTPLCEQSETSICSEGKVQSAVAVPSIEPKSDLRTQEGQRSDESTLTLDTIFLMRRSNSTKLEAKLTDMQILSLNSKISKFMVQHTANASKESPDQRKKMVVLWRNLQDDTPELAGFPIPYLSECVRSMIHLSHPSIIATLENVSDVDKTNETFVDWDTVVPYLDAYTFEAGGGVSGLAYGVTGVADGTKICTTPVGDLRTTIPRNYIQTSDGYLYELGRPSFAGDSVVQTTPQAYSLIGATKKWFRDGKVAASLMVNNAGVSNIDKKSRDFTIDPELFKLAGLTTLVLFCAAAMESLSHHLTVNVFWV
jgi:hypothetical protein